MDEQFLPRLSIIFFLLLFQHIIVQKPEAFPGLLVRRDLYFLCILRELSIKLCLQIPSSFYFTITYVKGVLAIISSLDPSPALRRRLSRQELTTSLLLDALTRQSLSPHYSIQCCSLSSPFLKHSRIQENHGISSFAVGHISIFISGFCLLAGDANSLLPAAHLLCLFC